MQSNEAAVQGLAQDLGQFSLAHSGFTLQEQGLFHFEGQVNNGGQLTITNIFLFLEGPGDIIDGFKGFFHSDYLSGGPPAS